MSESAKAVFLSYASQDAEAARRICDSLRSGGVEVWFDADGGLEHGDEWDAKIRRQIKECVLFIPVISANTQAREEGYFRLEWDLAAERARTIASGVPFILPVVIDETREPDALVPDRFRAVQWTKLPGGVVTPEVKARYLKLWSHRTGVLRNYEIAGKPPAAVESAGPASARATVGKPGVKTYALIAVAVAAIVAAAGWALLRAPVPKPPPPSATAAAPKPLSPAPAVVPANAAPAPAAAPGLSPARALAAKGDAIWLRPNSDRGDHQLAEDFYKQAVGLDALDGEVWAGYSKLCAAFVYRGFDRSAERRELVRTTAERAMRLAPESPDAKLAAAGYQWQQRINLDQIEQTLREVLRLRPGDHSLMRFLSLVIRTEGKFDESLALLDASAAAPGGDPIALTDKANALLAKGREEEASQAVDASLAQEPLDSALTFKVYFDLFIRGDRAAAGKTYAALPEAIRLTDRGAYYGTLVYLWNREPAKAMALLRRVDRPYFNDFSMTPCSYWTGCAEHMLGHADAAAVEWRVALETVEKFYAKTPNRPELFMWRAKLHAVLGETDEAERALRTYEQMVNYTFSPDRNMPGDLIDIYLALGRKAEVMSWIKTTTAKLASRYRPRWRAFLGDDPQFDSLRGNAEFDAIVASLNAPATRDGDSALAGDIKSVMFDKTSVADKPAPEKSVAVLAFSDLSEKHDSEYFSDGISEELLNVLAKIPDLKVTARTSAFFFKGKNVPIPEIARQLGVAYVVEGSVRKAGDKVRITAQLIKAADGFHVWSEDFDRQLKDIFSVQDEIAGLIAKNLSLKLSLTAGGAGANADALALYLEGRAAWNLRTVAGFARAEELFQRTLALDPKFARAHVGLADVWLLQRTTGAVQEPTDFASRNSPSFQRIMDAIDQALALDPNCAEAYAALGGVQDQRWNLPEAERQLRHALVLNPNYASAHQWLARVLQQSGAIEEALAEYDRAVQVDPLSHRILDNLASALESAGRPREAFAAIERARVLNPRGTQINCVRTRLLWQVGRRDEALASAQQLLIDPEAVAEDPDLARYTALSVLAAAGRRVEAEALLSRFPPDTEYWVLSKFILGQGREVLVKLDAIGEGNVEEFLYGPPFHEFDSVRDHPVFQAWLTKVGLAEAHARVQAWQKAHPPETGGQKTEDGGRKK